MLCDGNLLTVDLDNDTDEELIRAQQWLKDQLEKRKYNKHHALYVNAWGTNNPVLIALGAAMMRFVHRQPMSEVADKLPCKAEASKVAYYLADHYKVWYDAMDREKLSEEEEKLLKAILREFDVSTFIFTFTHYDECSNGYFFRRS